MKDTIEQRKEQQLLDEYKALKAEIFSLESKRSVAQGMSEYYTGKRKEVERINPKGCFRVQSEKCKQREMFDGKLKVKEDDKQIYDETLASLHKRRDEMEATFKERKIAYTPPEPVFKEKAYGHPISRSGPPEGIKTTHWGGAVRNDPTVY